MKNDRISMSNRWCRSLMRRAAASLVAVAILCVLAADQASALSTSGEIAQARSTDRDIVNEQGVVQNPLLNAWVDRVAASDWRFVSRKDVPYSIKILDESDVNAFTTGGGFIYVNEGTLDFVASDDELAGVIGHETGHNEHRHPITLRQRGELLSIIFGLAAIFAPASFGIGAFAQEGLMAHASRTDEYQADQFGLFVMNKAGYDPDAMLSFMQRLGASTAGEEVDRYLADHPGVPERIKRLGGYSELAPATRTPDKLLRDALHDAATSRYAIAMAQLQRVVVKAPHSATAWTALGRIQIALGYPSRARQSFERAQTYGDAAERAAATAELAALPFAPAPAAVPSVGEIGSLRAAILERRKALQQDSVGFSAEVTTDRLRLASIQARLDVLTNETDELAGLRDDSKSETSLPHQLARFGGKINATVERASTVLSGVGTLSLGRESGTLADASEIMQQIAALAASDAPAPASISRLRAVPAMLDAIAQVQNELRTSVEHTTETLAQLNRGLDQFEIFIRLAKTMRGAQGDDLDLQRSKPLLDSAALTKSLLTAALDTGDVAVDAYNRARALALSDRITLLGVDTTPFENDAFRRAVAQRCGTAPPSPELVAQDRLAPGDVAAATVIAAERQRSADDVVRDAVEQHRPLIAVSSAVHEDTLALEIFLGLIYLDYTDELPKAAEHVGNADHSIGRRDLLASAERLERGGVTTRRQASISHLILRRSGADRRVSFDVVKRRPRSIAGRRCRRDARDDRPATA